MINIEQIVKISSFFTVISHTKGRLRVRVNPKIKNETNSISLSDIETLPQKLAGIISIKINTIIASVTIMYDPEVFRPQLWDDLLANRNLDELSLLINQLAKEV